MKPVKKRRSSRTSPITAVAVVFVFLCLGGGLFYLVSNDKGGGKKVFVAKVDLVKPNLPDKPPPPPKEQPPEPEQKKEAIVAPQSVDQPQEARNMKGDDKPAASGPLGVEGEGGAGGDGFGLVGRGKGGRDVTTVGTGPGTVGGDRDRGALMRKHARYNQLVQEEINRAVRKRLDENGGIPKGKVEAVIQIGMDDTGTITDFRIVRLSGNHAVDEAVRKSLGYARVSEPPPQDIPRGAKGLAIMSIKITSQG
jgi:periplasmic protein TonB